MWGFLGLFGSLTLFFDILCFGTCKQLTTADISFGNPENGFLTLQPVTYLVQYKKYTTSESKQPFYFRNYVQLSY